MGLKQFVRNIVYDHASIRGIWLHSQKIKRRFLYLRNYGISDWFFDKWNGIETAAVIPGELNLDRPAIATDYLPVRPRVLLRALSSLKIDYPKYVFIDVGSGKGRGVFLASRFPFRKLIGVEIAKALQAKAQKNLKVWHTDDPGRIEFVWMRVMLDRIRNSREKCPREVIMIYVNPEHESVINSCWPMAERMSSFAGKYCYVTYRLSQVLRPA